MNESHERAPTPHAHNTHPIGVGHRLEKMSSAEAGVILGTRELQLSRGTLKRSPALAPISEERYRRVEENTKPIGSRDDYDCTLPPST